MKFLIIQETDWELRGPHQQHHLMERLSITENEIRVIDYEFLWQTSRNRKIIERTKKFKANPKVIPNSKIWVIRPWMVKLPILNYLFIQISHSYHILREIKKFKPDIIIGFGILNCFIGLLLAKLYNIPFYYYLIDHLHKLLLSRIYQVIGKFFESFNIKNCDRLFAINQGLIDYSVDLGGTYKNSVIIPGGVDLKRYQIFNEKSNIRKELGFKENNIVLMFMGWIYNFSGLREIVDYMAENEDRVSNFRLLVVGSGDLYDYIRIKREKLKNSNLIVLTGKVPYHKIPYYLQSADFCLLPSYNNDIMRNIVPIKLYEYLAAGKPVIASKLNGVYKEFQNDNGIIYINKPVDVFNKVKEVFKEREIIAKQGLEFVKNYDWKIIIDKFLINIK